MPCQAVGLTGKGLSAGPTRGGLGRLGDRQVEAKDGVRSSSMRSLAVAASHIVGEALGDEQQVDAVAADLLFDVAPDGARCRSCWSRRRGPCVRRRSGCA